MGSGGDPTFRAEQDLPRVGADEEICPDGDGEEHQGDGSISSGELGDEEDERECGEGAEDRGG